MHTNGKNHHYSWSNIIATKARTLELTKMAISGSRQLFAKGEILTNSSHLSI